MLWVLLSSQHGWQCQQHLSLLVLCAHVPNILLLREKPAGFVCCQQLLQPGMIAFRKVHHLQLSALTHGSKGPQALSSQSWVCRQGAGSSGSSHS